MKFRGYVTSAILGGGLMFLQLGAASAQDITDSHLAAARGAISAIQATDQFDDILPQMALNLKNQLIANNPDLEQQINLAVDEQTLALVSRRGDLENEAARVYAKAISEENLNAIAEFYNSDAGKALLSNGPIVAREVQSAAVVWQRGIDRDLRENVSAQLSEIAPRLSENKTDDAAAGAEEAPKAE